MNLSDRKLVSVFKALAKRPADSAKQERARAEFTEMRTRVEERAPLAMVEDGDRVACRCQGGNKDCCFCGGRGFYPRA